jgi:hypothetical protein
MNVCRMLVAKLANALAGLVDSVSEYAALIKPAANPCPWRLSGQLRLMALAKILEAKRRRSGTDDRLAARSGGHLRSAGSRGAGVYQSTAELVLARRHS